MFLYSIFWHSYNQRNRRSIVRVSRNVRIKEMYDILSSSPENRKVTKLQKRFKEFILLLVNVNPMPVWLKPLNYHHDALCCGLLLSAVVWFYIGMPWLSLLLPNVTMWSRGSWCKSHYDVTCLLSAKKNCGNIVVYRQTSWVKKLVSAYTVPHFNYRNVVLWFPNS